jgi:hypothetical protein
MTNNTATQLPSWAEVVRSHLSELTPHAAGWSLHLEQVAAAVATADAGLVEAASRTRDPFSWAAAAVECGDAAACFEELPDWPIHRRLVPAACRLADAATDELLAGTCQLLTAAHSATLTCPRSRPILAPRCCSPTQPLTLILQPGLGDGRVVARKCPCCKGKS